MKTIVGKKIGMTQIYAQDGTAVPVTVLSVADVKIARQVKLGDKVTHFEIGAGKKKTAIKSLLGNYSQLGYVPAFRTSFPVDAEVLEVGTDLSPEMFEVGDKVTVTGTSKGKGFQGVMVRHNFRGGPATHGGPSGKSRSPGSIGPGTTVGRVLKGTRMAGRMGGERKTVPNLKVVMIDSENKLIAISGAVPGNRGSYVIVEGK